MNNPLAPEPILRAALEVVHVAAYTTRNWALNTEMSRQLHDTVCDSSTRITAKGYAPGVSLIYPHEVA